VGGDPLPGGAGRAAGEGSKGFVRFRQLLGPVVRFNDWPVRFKADKRRGLSGSNKPRGAPRWRGVGEVVELEFLFRVRLARGRQDAPAPGVDTPVHDTTLDALVERAEESHAPELHRESPEPEWENHRRIGF
jgi:hypothetical protein